jgi:hypothetical protein
MSEDTVFLEAKILDVDADVIRCQIFDPLGKQIIKATLHRPTVLKCFDLAAWCASRYVPVEAAIEQHVIIEITEQCAQSLGISTT